MVRGWWGRWPTWSPYAALGWSVLYGALALGWALGAPGFPFGEHDPEGAAMGSMLFAARAEPTGWVMAGCCLVGAVVAIAMRRPTGQRRRRRILLAVAWCLAITLLLVLPDIRLLQNLAYGLMFVFVKLDWRVLHQGVVVLGGCLWAMTAIGYRRRNADADAAGGMAEVAAGRTWALVRWGRVATYVAVLAPLPYGITRLAWALGVPLGLDQDLSGNPVTARIGEAGLATLARVPDRQASWTPGSPMPRRCSPRQPRTRFLACRDSTRIRFIQTGASRSHQETAAGRRILDRLQGGSRPLYGVSIATASR